MSNTRAYYSWLLGMFSVVIITPLPVMLYLGGACLVMLFLV